MKLIKINCVKYCMLDLPSFMLLANYTHPFTLWCKFKHSQDSEMFQTLTLQKQGSLFPILFHLKYYFILFNQNELL